MSTFLESYEEHIQHTLDTGGDPKAVDVAMREHNAIGMPYWDGSVEFFAWVKETPHVCGECFKSFTFTKCPNVSPRDEKRCLVCLPGQYGEADGPTKSLDGDA